MKYIGIDLHSNKFNICIIYENNTKKHLAFWLTVSDINDFLKHVDKETFIMVEASTNTFRFVDCIKDKAREVYVANTHKLKLISLVKQIKILTSMKGISVFTAIAIIADVSEIERFNSSKKLSSYLRSTPGIDISNDTFRNLKTNKFGRKLSITLLSQSLNHFRDSNLKIKKWYDKKIEQKKPKGKARMAICRRVFTEIYQMLKKGEYHNYRDEQNHLSKIQGYNNFLNNYKVEDKYEYFLKKNA